MNDTHSDQIYYSSPFHLSCFCEIKAFYISWASNDQFCHSLVLAYQGLFRSQVVAILNSRSCISNSRVTEGPKRL